jgi:hypothetical protein
MNKNGQYLKKFYVPLPQEAKKWEQAVTAEKSKNEENNDLEKQRR